MYAVLGHFRTQDLRDIRCLGPETASSDRGLPQARQEVSITGTFINDLVTYSGRVASRQ
jgi:hypothetical protein